MNRKMLVRAFAKIAKRWGDSAKTPYTFSMYGYKNARSWGRIIADNYESDMLEAYEDWIDTPLNEWGQAEYDCFADEEISCW
nr:MAG TPA: hypothetical protein [Caudoviricetes sp.]